MCDRCRGCGRTGPDLVIAEEHHAWVQDEDDLGYPHCRACITRFTAFNAACNTPTPRLALVPALTEEPNYA